MARKLLVSIINFRTAELTLGCLRSVLADLGGIDAEVVVVDNASGDGSAEAIAAWLAERLADGPATPVRLIRSATNSGFSGGHNQAMAAVPADYVLILNSDAILRPGFCAAILAAAEADASAGLIAPRIETDAGVAQANCFRFHGPLSELIRGANSGPLTRLFSGHVVALDPDEPDPGRIEWASFACILLAGRMVAALGPMDEGYFLYFEDAEYSLRARRAGWRIVRAPQAVMVHFRGGSGPVKALERARRRLPGYYYASRARFLAQAHGRAGPLAANLMWLLGRGLAQGRRLAGKRVPPAIEAEARDIWINAFNPLGPRRAPGD